ncbi:hypothetical protein [Methyloradius palustris]|nr:hypothetical protein [Methyloradius palustris]
MSELVTSMQTKEVNPETLRQRRAVYHGLCSVLTEAEAFAALAIWDENASQSKSVFSGLNVYVRDVCTQFGKIEAQRELSQAINRALIAKSGDLTPLPESAPTATPITAQSEASEILESLSKPAPVAAAPVTPAANYGDTATITPEFQTFQVLLLAVLEHVDKQSATTGLECRDFIREVVSHLPWSEAQQQQLINLVDTGSTVQTRSYRAGQLKTMFGHLKAWLDDNIGKPASALAIEQALATAAKSSYASDYAPKLFVK